MSKQYTLIDLLYIARIHQKFLAIVFIVSAVLSIAISLLLPKWYKASARLLPPKPETGLLALSDIQNALPLGGLNLLGGDNEILEFLAILESRTLLNAIVQKFDLKKRYEAKNIEDARAALLKNCEFKVEENGTLSISVLDKKPEVAASIANYFVILLDSLNIRFKTGKARQDRIFIEKRLKTSEKELAEAEDEFKKFQETYSAVALDEQTKALIETAAALQAQIYTLEVELSVKEKFLSSKHYTIVSLKRQLNELNKKLEEILGKSQPDKGFTKKTDNLFIPFEELPSLGLAYARLYRDLQVQGKIYEFLFKEYEQAKIREAHTTPTLQVLDPAVPPIHKARPKRSLIVIITVFCAMIFAFSGLVLKDMLLRLKTDAPEKFQKVKTIFGRLIS